MVHSLEDESLRDDNYPTLGRLNTKTTLSYRISSCLSRKNHTGTPLPELHGRLD